jgi:hypothetical protein
MPTLLVSGRRTYWLVGAVLLVSPLSGCATVIGTAISPIAFPVDVVTCAGGFEWRHAYLLPFAVLVSPFVGLCVGAEVDYHLIDPGWEWPIHRVLRPLRHAGH